MPAPDLIAALTATTAFPDQASGVEVVETHMSWVFLTETRAYKLKKAVRYALLDHRTPEARRRACEEEVRLNRRLAPSVYLGVLPVVRDGPGVRVGGEGPVVDWVVQMRRLAADRMLDRKIVDGTLRPEEHRGAAALLARFYRAAPPVDMGAGEYRRGIERELLATRHELVDPRAGLAAADVDAATDAALAALASAPGLLGERIAARRVVEGHGDLRPEHIALGPVPAVIDCLEFDRPLRILDAADELAFLALECERLGAPRVGAAFLDEYTRITGDDPPERLVRIYSVLRSLVRAKLAVWHAREPADEAARWIARGRAYVALARAHARSLG